MKIALQLKLFAATMVFLSGAALSLPNTPNAVNDEHSAAPPCRNR